MRFHVVSLPHTHTTEEFSVCAYTEKVRKFCIMMKNLGHTVYLYAGEKNEAPCDEHIACIGERLRAQSLGPLHYTQASFDDQKLHWKVFNHRVIAELASRLHPKDFLCLIGGWPQKAIADAYPEITAVEFGVGYGGTFAKYKVYESYAWMHTCYGAAAGKPMNANGAFFDAVIPGYLEPEKFPFSAEKDDYFLYVGRLVDRKGYAIAIDACRASGHKLITAGPGELNDPPSFVEHFGVIGPEERGHLMSRARALFVPTLYIEPFGNVAVEAMACGTPVISTDWGAMTETVIDGVTGYRCRTLQEFVNATRKVQGLTPSVIRESALARYSLDVVGLQYHHYFHRLDTLWGDGWLQLDEEDRAQRDRAA